MYNSNATEVSDTWLPSVITDAQKGQLRLRHSYSPVICEQTIKDPYEVLQNFPTQFYYLSVHNPLLRLLLIQPGDPRDFSRIRGWLQVHIAFFPTYQLYN